MPPNNLVAPMIQENRMKLINLGKASSKTLGSINFNTVLDPAGVPGQYKPRQ